MMVSKSQPTFCVRDFQPNQKDKQRWKLGPHVLLEFVEHANYPEATHTNEFYTEHTYNAMKPYDRNMGSGRHIGLHMEYQYIPFLPVFYSWDVYAK
jgi:hypothetical protein